MLVFEGFLSTPEMVELFSETAVVQAMMDFEAALARAQARCGLIPSSAAQAIASLCRAELYDVSAMVGASARAGSLALPVVRKLTETVALFDPVAAGFVHWGSTSQDVVDTAMVLQTRRALALIQNDLLELCARLLALAEQFADTPVLAHALLQPAQVSSLRVKLLNWLLPLLRSAEALQLQARSALQLQLGGAVGTLTGMGAAGWDVVHAMAAELELAAPQMAWHTQRDAWLRLGSELALLCGNLGKLGRDLSLMAQAERAELMEPQESPRGAAVLPHRRQPLAALQSVAAATRAPQRMAGLLAAMAQEEERGLGNWQAETAEWAGLLLGTHGSLHTLNRSMAGLELFPARMLENIDKHKDLVFAEALAALLAPLLGRSAAQQRVQMLCAEVPLSGHSLRLLARRMLAEDALLSQRLPVAQLDAIFDVHAKAHQADAAVEPALAWARQSLMQLRQPS